MARRKLKEITEIATAWIGVVALIAGGIFGSVQYLDKKRDDRIKETMNFLDRYNAGVIFEDRRTITEAWRKHADEQDALMSKDVSAERFNQFVLRVVREEGLEAPIARMHGFYETLNACIQSEICERGVAISLFQRNAHRMYVLHYAYIMFERERRNDPSYGAALQHIAKMQ